MNRKRVGLTVAALLLGVMLSACTIYVQPGFPFQGEDLDDVIVDFRPDRGSGASYRVGDEIRFVIRTREPGFVTLTALDPDGRVYVLSRNIRVESGTTVLPTAAQRVSYSAAPPRGLHRVRASFTSQRTSETVVYQGIYGDGEWTSALSIEVRPSQLRDIEETSLRIR